MAGPLRGHGLEDSAFMKFSISFAAISLASLCVQVRVSPSSSKPPG
jgi:hypothetical protein